MNNIHNNHKFEENDNFTYMPVTPVSSETVTARLHALTRTCTYLQTACFGRSVAGRSLLLAKIGFGGRKVFFSASHHANEWVSTWVLMRFLEELCKKAICSESIYHIPAMKILECATIFIAPMVNPDGVDLVTGRLSCGPYFENAKEISKLYPDIPFPEGWKANIEGVDLNLQYPAGWQIAKKAKAEMGISSCAPQNFVGAKPLCEPESRSMYTLTRRLIPDTVVALHSQGEVIYWKYADFEPEGSYELGKVLSSVSGYALEETPAESGNAGFKDWFIKEFDRPGYTVEMGLGQNPLPSSQFEKIYSDVMPLLVCASLGEKNLC